MFLIRFPQLKATCQNPALCQFYEVGIAVCDKRWCDCGW